MAAPATVSVFSILRDTTGTPIANGRVQCVLSINYATVAATGDALDEIQQSTTTDTTGRYAFTVVPNDLIAPSGTVYTIMEPHRSYQIAPQSANGSPQQTTAANVIVNVPTPLAPATSSITGPLTITGALSVGGLITAQAGLTLTGTLSIPAGGFSMAGPLTLTAAAAQIIPGATSFSVRDTGNANDNLLVSNAGLVTARAGLVATAGGLTASAGGAAITGNSTITGTLTVSSTINAQTISAAASFTGTLTVASTLTVSAGGLIVTAGGLTINAGGLSVNGGTTTVLALTASGTVTVPDSSFTMRKLKTTSATDRATASGTWTAISATATFANLTAGPSLSLTPAVTSTVWVWWSVNFHSSGAAGALDQFRLQMDGTTNGLTWEAANPVSAYTMQITGLDVFTGVSAAAHTFQIQVATPAGATTITADGTGAAMVALAIP